MPPTKKITSAIGRPVWADVSFSALIHNLNAIRDFVNPKSEKRTTPRKILSIVKGNGYGHGGPQVAKVLEKAGSDWFGVTGAGEGEQVRKAGVRKPILALTSFWPTKFLQPSSAANSWLLLIPRHHARHSPSAPPAST